MDTILKTTDLVKKYGRRAVVNRVNMTVNRGDIYGFIGKNGAGKTTLMRLALGLAFPTSGKIELFGGERLSTARRRIGSLVEIPSLYRDCTARENLKRIGMLCGTREQDIGEILDLVGLSDVGTKKVAQFSLGMKQRLGVGVALLGRPEFLILDEPVNGMDPTGIKEVRDLILRLNRELGITFLISSHLLDELSKIVTKYGIINNGELAEEITTEELAQKCRTRFVLTCSRPQEAKELLLAKNPDCEILCGEDEITVHEGFGTPAAVNRILVEGGIDVFRLITQAENVENYFVERIGEFDA